MNFINILRKLHTLLEKRSIDFYGCLQRMNSNRFTGRIFKYLRKLKMANTWISEMENDIKEFQIMQEDITEHTPLRHKLHNFKVSRKNQEEKQELFGLRKGERNIETYGMKERDVEGKEKGSKQLKQTQSIVGYSK